jgi:hypothetical protein
MSFFKASRKKPKEFRVPQIRFLGEQDGPPERILKERLADFFRRHRSVNRAYLARVDFGEGKDATVVLGLRTGLDPDKGIVETVGTIFASVFDAKKHLDIMFLTEHEEAELSGVCPPFFEQC